MEKQILSQTGAWVGEKAEAHQTGFCILQTEQIFRYLKYRNFENASECNYKTYRIKALRITWLPEFLLGGGENFETVVDSALW